MPPRVVLYTASPTYGGAERVMIEQAVGLRRRGFDPIVMTESAKGLEALIADCARLALPVLSMDRGGRIAFQLGLTHRLLALSPHIFHLHRGWPAPGAAALVAASTAGVPVRLVHEHLWAEPPPRSRWLNRAVRRSVTMYVAVSEDVARRLRGDLGVPAHRIRVIHNGIDISSFSSSGRHEKHLAVGQPAAPFTVLTVARLTAQKGIGVLIAAAAMLPEVRFLVAGDGPDRGELEHEARERGVADRFTLLGQRSDIRELLAMCDLFVLPSFVEGLPIVVLEAMASRCPIVATDVEGTREAVTAGESAVLVLAGDAAALAGAIRTAMNDPNLRARLVEAAYERVTARFSAEAMVDAVAGLYRESLASATRT